MLILLVGVASASEISQDSTGTDSSTEEAVLENTPTVSDTANNIQENSGYEGIHISQASYNKLDEDHTNTIEKTTKNTKKDTTISSWEDLQIAVYYLNNQNQDTTLTLSDGTYINNGVVRWDNPNMVLTIDCNGQTIEGKQRQAFYTGYGTSLVLKNMIITNAKSDIGGAINNHGNLTIINSTLLNNSAINDGGAIYNAGFLTIVNSTLANNTANNNGGAIINYDKVNITRSMLLNNTANRDGGAIRNNGTSTITQSTLANNTANNNGGAIYSPGAINLTRNIFINNTADNMETIDLYEYKNGQFNSNTYNSTDISLNTLELNIKDNKTIYDVGEDVVLNFSIALEHPDYYDEDILERLGDITIYVNDVETATTRYENYTLSNLKQGKYTVYIKTCNQESKHITIQVDYITNWQQLSYEVSDAEDATEDLTLTLMKGKYVNNGTITWSNPNIVLTLDGDGNTINGNQLRAFNINRGASLILKNFTITNAKSDIGGAIYNNGTLTIIQSTLNKNNANSGGAIYNNGTLTITQSTLADNTAAINGGTIYNNGTLTIIESTLNKNNANSGGAIYNNRNLTVTNSTLADNTADDFGGVIYNYGNLTIANSTLANSTARDEGGAIYNKGTLNITQSTLENNKVIYNEGGAVYNKGTLNIAQSVLNNNTAISLGGAIYNYENTTVTQSTLANNTANNGGAISNYIGTVAIAQSTLANNNVSQDGGALYNDGTLTITESTLANNTASGSGGAIINKNYKYFNVTDTNFTNNHAKKGGAILTPGFLNLTNDIFTSNTADNKETIDLAKQDFLTRYKNNIYNSTDIALKNIELKVKDNQTLFNTTEKVILNYSIALEHPTYYDSDIVERLEDITVYINGAEYATTKYENYTLSDLEPGEYTAYIKTSNQESNNVTFNIFDEKQIKVTTWDVEMVRARGVTFSAIVDYENSTINQGQVYFEIDGKPLTDENGSTLYAPVKNNHADLPYIMPSDISVGNHTLTAVYLYDDRILATDDKVLTIIDDMPEGSGDDDKNPSKNEKKDTYNQDTRFQKEIAKYIKVLQYSIPTSHLVLTANKMITLTDTITLDKLNEIFGQTFTNGHLLLYIDGELVYNGTVGDDLATVILEIVEKFLGKHELKVEFTDADGKINTYTENVTIT